MASPDIDELLRNAEQRLRKPSTLVKHEDPPLNKAAVDFTAEQKHWEPGMSAKAAPISVRNPHQKPQNTKDDAGPAWFGLPKTNLTADFKRDWQMLRVRGILDPKHHKKTLHKNPPAYSQVGEIVAGPTDSRASRLTRKQKKATLFDEIMHDQNTDKLTTKFAGIQKVRNSGKRKSRQKGRR